MRQRRPGYATGRGSNRHLLDLMMKIERLARAAYRRRPLRNGNRVTVPHDAPRDVRMRGPRTGTIAG